MISDPQLCLTLRLERRSGERAPEAHADWLAELLGGREAWTTAAEILQAAGLAGTEDNKRWLRLVRRATAGRVLGGPGFPGYRRTDTLTGAEYQHWRNAMLSQADEMRAAVLEADRVHYARSPLN